MSEEEIVSQMRTVISAGYETVSAIIAVSTNTSRSVNQTAFLMSVDLSGYYTN